jgi:hypothetical protein
MYEGSYLDDSDRGRVFGVEGRLGREKGPVGCVKGSLLLLLLLLENCLVSL